MKHIITVIKHIDAILFDVVVVPENYSCVLEVIATCKSQENADWIVDLILKESSNNV